MNFNKQYINDYVNNLLNSQKNENMKNILFDLQTFICLAGKTSSSAIEKLFRITKGYLISTSLDMNNENQKIIRIQYFGNSQKPDLTEIGMNINWNSIEEKEIGFRLLRSIEKYCYLFTNKEVEVIISFYSFIVGYLDANKPSQLQCLLCKKLFSRKNDDPISGGDINFICIKCRTTCQRCKKNKIDSLSSLDIKKLAENSFPKVITISKKYTSCQKCLKYYIYRGGTYFEDFVDSTHNSCKNPTKLCSLCNLNFQLKETYYHSEFGNRRFGCYIANEGGVYVCNKCNNLIQNAPICKKCDEYFESRNELFQHLRQFEDHQI